MSRLTPWTLIVLSLVTTVVLGDEATSDKKPPKPKQSPSVEKLAKETRDSVVQITFTGREGKQQGLGTGFIISPDGLIATNLHVLSEGRPIKVELANGKKFDVKSILASDRTLDLAIVRIDGKDLPALKLGDSEKVAQGQAVVAMGNPHGLKHSVVSGVVSDRREMEGRKMLQLAMPIEPGNSGGPVLDAKGQVIGVVTMKSLVTENLGFAVEINHLRPLIDKPNPVLMSKWLTIGVLDPRDWTPRLGAKWRRQKSGRIAASGIGQDPIGKRTLCDSNIELPKRPFELGVSVRLENESGAAGLIFHSDGGDKHYGFYPSRGRMRISRFEGPSVFQWKVLREFESEHYRPGQWNHLKVRFEKNKFLFYVNDHLVAESNDAVLPTGKVGLAKFREPAAEFKQFRVAKSIPSSRVSEETQKKLNELIDKLPEFASLQDEQLEPLSKSPAASTTVLRKRAAELKSRAEELQRMANDIHVRGLADELGSLLKDEMKADLLQAALLIARLDDEELDVDVYQKQFDRMVEDITSSLAKDADEKSRLDALNKYLFAENGFHGSRTNYYHRANSYINSVLEDREGLPITMSVLYMELGRRIGLKIEGVGLPGHFVVKHVPKVGDEQLIDVFDQGRLMKREEADRLVRRAFGEPLRDEHLRGATKSEIVQRMLRNLRGIAESKRDTEAVLRYLEALLAVDSELLQERLMRAFARFHTGRRDAAIADLDWLLAKEPEGMDLDQVRKAREFMRTQKPALKPSIQE